MEVLNVEVAIFGTFQPTTLIIFGSVPLSLFSDHWQLNKSRTLTEKILFEFQRYQMDPLLHPIASLR